MIVFVQYRLPRDGATVQNYVEMTGEQYAVLIERREVIMRQPEAVRFANYHQLRMEVEATYPSCHHKLRRYCEGEI